MRDNIPTTKHILAGGMRVASKFVPNDANEECAACPDRPSVTYFHSDHLGSTSFATDEEQTLLSRQQYFPSGELWLDQTNSITAAQQPYLFSGKELDVETGLYYFGARYYDPRAGLWTTPDPILLQYMLGAPNSGVHFPRNLALYTYAINNPVIVQDSDGRAWWTKALKVGRALYKGGDMAMAFADAIENYNTVTNANASTGERVWAGVQLLSEVAPISVSDIKDAGRIVGVVDKIGDAGKGVKQAGNVGDAAKRLPDDALVCRGGTCTADRFANGSGVTLDNAGKLQGASVNSAPGATLEQLTEKIPNKQVGVTTVGQVRAAGGDVTPSPTKKNPLHCTMCGITPQKAETLFTPTVKNPNAP